MGSQEAPLGLATRHYHLPRLQIGLESFEAGGKMNGQEEKSGGLCEKQPYRNAAMVLAEARSIHNKDKEEENNRIIASSGEPDTKAFRNNSLLLAEAKTIYSLYDTGNKWKVPSGDPEPSAYRTSTLLLPEAKSIYSLEDTGNKFLQPSGDPDERAFRTAPLVMAEPKKNNNKYITPSGAPDSKAFRTSPIVLAEAKSIYGPDTTGNKYKQPSGLLDEANLPYRNSSFNTAGPKTINDTKIGLGYWEIAISTPQTRPAQSA